MRIRESEYSVQGVTLVEILMVIGVLAILVAVLIPWGHELIVKNQGIQCASHMRSITVAMLGYVAENNGMFPPYSLETENVKDIGQERRWPTLFFDSLGIKTFYCPTLQNPRKGDAQFVDYGYNYLFIGSQQNGVYGSGEWVNRGRPVAHISTIPEPSKTLLLAESLTTSGSAAGKVGFYILGYQNNGAFRVDARHHKGVMIAWVDGHLSYEEPDKNYNFPKEWFMIDKP